MLRVLVALKFTPLYLIFKEYDRHNTRTRATTIHKKDSDDIDIDINNFTPQRFDVVEDVREEEEEEEEEQQQQQQ